MTAFDNIAKLYHKLDVLPLPHSVHINAYTYLNLIGNVADKSILDLACGDGCYTRMFKPSAKYVVGVDISENMIEIAKQEEARKPLGIEYIVRDVLELDEFGKFDLVVASFLLNHAQTKEQLLKMCQIIYLNLKSGCRFVTLNANVGMPPEQYPKLQKYGITKTISGPLQEGTPINLTFTVEGQQFCINDFYFSKAIYDWAFQKAGFKKVFWHKPMVSLEGIQEYGQEFWQDALDYPMNWFIECMK